MSVLMWIHLMFDIDSVLNIYFLKVNCEKKSADDKKSMKNCPECKELKYEET